MLVLVKKSGSNSSGIGGGSSNQQNSSRSINCSFVTKGRLAAGVVLMFIGSNMQN